MLYRASSVSRFDVGVTLVVLGGASDHDFPDDFHPLLLNFFGADPGPQQTRGVCRGGGGHTARRSGPGCVCCAGDALLGEGVERLSARSQDRVAVLGHGSATCSFRPSRASTASRVPAVLGGSRRRCAPTPCGTRPGRCPAGNHGAPEAAGQVPGPRGDQLFGVLGQPPSSGEHRSQGLDGLQREGLHPASR